MLVLLGCVAVSRRRQRRNDNVESAARHNTGGGHGIDDVPLTETGPADVYSEKSLASSGYSHIPARARDDYELGDLAMAPGAGEYGRLAPAADALYDVGNIETQR